MVTYYSGGEQDSVIVKPTSAWSTNYCESMSNNSKEQEINMESSPLETAETVVTETSQPAESHKKMKRKYLLGKNFLWAYHIFCRIVCTGTLITQIALMDYYLIVYHDVLWGLWIASDVVVVTLFCVTMTISYRYLKNRPLVALPAVLGELPLTYMTWLVYSVLLTAKIYVLYAPPTSIASALIEKNFFGPNMLRTAISLSCIIVYLVVLTSHDCRSRTPQNDFILTIFGSIAFDLLDTTQFLGCIREERGVMNPILVYAIVFVIGFNFILPTEVLFVLSKKHFGKLPMSLRNQMLHRIIYFMLVNIPIFTIRMVIWHLNDLNVSVFLVKNVLAIGLAIRDIHEFTIDLGEVIKAELHLNDEDDSDGIKSIDTKKKHDTVVAMEMKQTNKKNTPVDEKAHLKESDALKQSTGA